MHHPLPAHHLQDWLAYLPLCYYRSGGIDDYDVAYDRGRVKKVQQKGVAADGISAATIQVAWEDSRRNHGGTNVITFAQTLAIQMTAET